MTVTGWAKSDSAPETGSTIARFARPLTASSVGGECVSIPHGTLAPRGRARACSCADPPPRLARQLTVSIVGGERVSIPNGGFWRSSQQ
jgi:hypothetical protein